MMEPRNLLYLFGMIGIVLTMSILEYVYYIDRCTRIKPGESYQEVLSTQRTEEMMISIFKRIPNVSHEFINFRNTSYN